MIVKGDAMDVLMATESKFVDLVVTDPPYAFGGSGTEHALSATVALALRECARVLKRDAHLVVMCASSWRSISYMVESVRGTGFAPKRIGTWHKPVSKSKVQSGPWLWACVSVLVFSRGRPQAKATAKDHISAAPVVGGRRAQLPDAVCDWAVAPFAVPSGIFLDPFCGSGALVNAAERAGMQSIGVDVDPISWDVEND